MTVIERVLVTGATGKVGQEVVRGLLEAGFEVKAATRTPDVARELFEDEVEVVELNYDWASTYDGAVTWADRVFLMPPPFSPDAYESIVPFLDWAVASKVRHIVLLSAMMAERKDHLHLRKVELHLQDRGIEHTILRPNLYMQNFHPGFISQQIREDGRIRLPAGEERVSLVDVRDVAAVAVKALTSKDHFGKAYTLTGEESLTMGEAAAAVSKAAGRRIRYEPVSDEEFQRILEARGWRSEEVEVVLGLFGSIRRWWRAPIYPDLDRVLDRAPRFFSDFCEENASAWA